MKKDPNAKLPFSVDWSTWLVNENDTIASIEWIVPRGLIKASNPPAQVVDGKATVWLSGGMHRQTYTVTCRITTAGGRVDDRDLEILVENRRS